MTGFNAGGAIVVFVLTAVVTTWIKQSGGPFRLLFGFLVFVPIGLAFVQTYVVSAPAMAIAAIVGFVVGLLT